jgi:hypothetical protein
LRLGSGHDSYDCVSDVLELVLLCEGESEIIDRDRYIVRVFKTSSGQATIDETNILLETQGQYLLWVEDAKERFKLLPAHLL